MYWVDVHVIVLLKVLCEKLNRVIACMKAPLTLKDFLHLKNTGDHTLAGFSHLNTVVVKSCWSSKPYSETLFRSEKARSYGVMFVELEQHVFEPISHS